MDTDPVSYKEFDDYLRDLSPTARLGHDARQCGPPHREPQRR